MRERGSEGVRERGENEPIAQSLLFLTVRCTPPPIPRLLPVPGSSAIAVETLVARRPPHRSRRAVFPHRALQKYSLPHPASSHASRRLDPDPWPHSDPTTKKSSRSYGLAGTGAAGKDGEHRACKGSVAVQRRHKSTSVSVATADITGDERIQPPPAQGRCLAIYRPDPRPRTRK